MNRTGSKASKGRPNAADGQRKMAQVLAVASEQFSVLGYRRVTMRGVAHKARVSTRTLYNRYKDKLSLFKACLNFESQAFPQPEPTPGQSTEHVLVTYAIGIVRALSSDSNLRLAMQIYREGLEFPEVLRAAEAHEDQLLIQPLAAYLRTMGLERDGEDGRAKLFLAMALAQWQRTGSYRRPPPREAEIVHHAELAVQTFLRGVPALAEAKHRPQVSSAPKPLDRRPPPRPRTDQPSEARAALPPLELDE